MSTLPFSLGSYTPRKLIVTSNLHTPEETPSSSSSSSLKFSSHVHNETTTSPPALLKLNENPVVVFKRREAIGVGLCSGILGVILQQSQVSPAEAGEASAPCELTESPSGLAYCDKVVGYGPEAVKGQLIKAHYVGKLENGKVFDSSYNRGKPLTFRIGVGEVIKGWDQGILGGDGVPPMLAGGKRSLKLPPELGYGIRGAGCRGGSCIIPPDSVLLFDVEFIGQTHYLGKLENGKVFDSSYNRGKPLTFRVGVGEFIKGWDQGILGGDGVPPMLAGGKRSLKLPPELGYGIRGAGCRGGSCIIPPDSVLLFDVEFIGKG